MDIPSLLNSPVPTKKQLEHPTRSNLKASASSTANISNRKLRKQRKRGRHQTSPKLQTCSRSGCGQTFTEAVALEMHEFTRIVPPLQYRHQSTNLLVSCRL